MAFNPSALRVSTTPRQGPGIGILANAIAGIPGRQRQAELDKINIELINSEIELNRSKIEDAGKTGSMQRHSNNIVSVKSLLDSGNDIGALRELTNRRTDILEEMKTDPTVNTEDIDHLLNLYNTDRESLVSTVNAEHQKLGSSGFIEGFSASRSGRKSFAPVTLVNDSTGKKVFKIPTIDSNGQASLSDVDIPPGFRVMTETPEQKRAANLLSNLEELEKKLNLRIEKEPQLAADTKAATSSVGRREDQITKGLDAADGIAGLSRGIELMESVETGGIAGVALRIKQAFGIETADEGELSNQLAKAVLRQLRSTFGAAFTESEGDKLDRIEASFSKSPAANKRLLEQAKRLALRVANRGIRAALALGDEDAAKDIQDAIDFSLTPRDSNTTQEQTLRFDSQGNPIQ